MGSGPGRIQLVHFKEQEHTPFHKEQSSPNRIYVIEWINKLRKSEQMSEMKKDRESTDLCVQRPRTNLNNNSKCQEIDVPLEFPRRDMAKPPATCGFSLFRFGRELSICSVIFCILFPYHVISTNLIVALLSCVTRLVVVLCYSSSSCSSMNRFKYTHTHNVTQKHILADNNKEELLLLLPLQWHTNHNHCCLHLEEGELGGCFMVANKASIQ